MGINLADLIVEATIRDGLLFLKQNPAVVDDIFKPMLQGFNQRKYGQAEIEKIKTMLQTKTIAVVHSFYEAEAKSPCFSVQLGAENEAKDRAHLSDFEADIQVPLDPSTIIRVPSFTPTSYDLLTGMIKVDDSVSLEPLHAGYIFVDAQNKETEVLTGISNETGNKFFFVDRGLNELDVSGPCFIKTFLFYSQHEEKGDTSAVNILIGCHAKDALLTKYLYTILKYIFKSRKRDLIKRGFVNSTFSGSDFTRDLKYEGDFVYTRFFTLTGQVDDTWSSDNVELIDNVEIDGNPID